MTLVYEMYPGAPLLSKWMVVDSGSAAAAGVQVTHAVPETLRLAQPYSTQGQSIAGPSFLYVQTDQAHGTDVLWQQDSASGSSPGAVEGRLLTNYSSGPGVILTGKGGLGGPTNRWVLGANDMYASVYADLANEKFVRHGNGQEEQEQNEEEEEEEERHSHAHHQHSHEVHHHEVHHHEVHHHSHEHRNPVLHRTRIGSSVAEFVSFRTFLLVTDSADPERVGLSVRQLYRLLAPYALENPIFFHATETSDVGFKLEIDQMAAVGFEMLIYSFGSGFVMETTDPIYLNKIKAQIDYAKSKGIEVGGYDLICLDRGDGGYGGNVGLQWDAITPEGAYGMDACFASGWVDKLTNFVQTFVNKTGLAMLETDGPYGGGTCASTNHTYHAGASDGVYQQTQVQANWFAALRKQNVYINQPDIYFFQGGQRTPMGYNEDQYSLPRWQDITVSRMGMYDDLYMKTPTMGWMFLPLVDYHGGGAAAAFEPMSEHLAEYEMGLAQYLGAGVAACYRGFRLYDTPAVQAIVSKWVSIYKTYRDIITSDVIHIRRPDGQSLDAFMHANALLPVNKGFALVFNPTLETLTQQISFPLYYTGLTTKAAFSQEGAATPTVYTLNRDYSVVFPVTLKPQSVTWFAITEA